MRNLSAEENSPVARLTEFPSDRAAERNHVATRQKIEPVAIPVAIQKEYLPRRSGEFRFAPPQYVYSASTGGAVPTVSPISSPNTQAA
jgi:hypothetical protein